MHSVMKASSKEVDFNRHRKQFKILYKKVLPGVVAHACNPSTLGV